MTPSRRYPGPDKPLNITRRCVGPWTMHDTLCMIDFALADIRSQTGPVPAGEIIELKFITSTELSVTIGMEEVAYVYTYRFRRGPNAITAIERKQMVIE